MVSNQKAMVSLATFCQSFKANKYSAIRLLPVKASGCGVSELLEEQRFSD